MKNKKQIIVEISREGYFFKYQINDYKKNFFSEWTIGTTDLETTISKVYDLYPFDKIVINDKRVWEACKDRCSFKENI